MIPAVVIAVLLVLIVALVAMQRRQISPDRPLPGIDKLLASGQYEKAALLAMENQRPAEAIDYFLRAQQPGRAAQVAARFGMGREAAELYERARDWERAAGWYEKIGLSGRAKELREKVAPPVQPAASARPSILPSASLPPPAVPGFENPRTSRTSLPPSQTPEEIFREALSRSVGGEAEAVRLQELGMNAAEWLLAQGEVRRAAEVYRDAGMLEDAVQLFVNMLGAPGEAAPLVAKMGNHERAAELYEIAGQKERAAVAWSDVARAAVEPEVYLDRVERLSAKVALSLVGELVKERPLSAATADLHYRHATLLERNGEPARARTVYSAIQQTVGRYRDVEERMAALLNPPSPVDRKAATERGGGAERPAGPAPFSADRANAPEAEPPRDVIVQPIIVEGAMSDDEIQQLALEAARAAVSKARGRAVAAPVKAVRGTRMAGRGPRKAASTILASGLEEAPVEMTFAYDALVQAAREGPSVHALMGYTGNRPCDLGNIEVYYRLGLAHAAAGKWSEARAAFEAVEDASPGYRDADARAIELRAWEQSVMASSRSLVAVRSSLPGSHPEAPRRYALQGELGRGGMAVVYRARDEVLGRDLALKFIADNLSGQQDVRELFEREARAVASLNHPNIVTIYDFGVIEGRAFIAMEYIDGSSVESELDDRGRLPVIDALRVTQQVLAALEYAHARKIVHRDIKPSNMMRTTTGLVKLMDFGLAKSVAGKERTTVIAGTPAYMPPEQFRGVGIDARTDLFAVGVSLYEMLTGALPFATPDRIGKPFASVREHVPSLPTLLDEILVRALDADPSNRFQDAASFSRPLAEILGRVEEAARGGKGSMRGGMLERVAVG